MIKGAKVTTLGATSFFTALSKNAAKVVQTVVAKGTLMTHAAVVNEIQQGTKSGRVYKKANPSRVHQASAPGEAPATDTGSHVRSIHPVIEPNKGQVVANSPQAVNLEIGTSKMEARPSLQPALDKTKPKITAMLRAETIKAVRKSAKKAKGKNRR